MLLEIVARSLIPRLNPFSNPADKHFSAEFVSCLSSLVVVFSPFEEHDSKIFSHFSVMRLILRYESFFFFCKWKRHVFLKTCHYVQSPSIATITKPSIPLVRHLTRTFLVQNCTLSSIVSIISRHGEDLRLNFYGATA